MNHQLPHELRQDSRGLTRLERLQLADTLVASARFLAEGCTPTRHLNEIEIYIDSLDDAELLYREAGLGLLAERVERIPGWPIADAWAAFDEANATTGF